MLKICVFLFLSFLATNTFALCKMNEPMCDVKVLVPPVFLQDGFLDVSQRNALSLSDESRSVFLKKNTPYTIRCLISFKNFVSNKDQEMIYIKGWSDSVDSSNITYIEGNNEEIASHVPQISIHLENEYVLFKHIIVKDDHAVAYWIGPFSHKVSYDCTAWEEYPAN